VESTNAVEITQNMGFSGINRIENIFGFFRRRRSTTHVATNLQRINQDLFTIHKQPDPIELIEELQHTMKKKA
jgi:phosphoribosylformylglycinamidine synthase